MSSTPRGVVASRLAALAAVAMLVLAGVLALPAFRGATPPTARLSDAPMVRGSQQIGFWLAEADVTLRPDLGYRFDVRLTRDGAAPAPDRIRPIVVLEMADMSSIEPPLMLMGVGTYRAEGTLPMPGQWRFRVGLEDEFLDLVVEVP